MSSVTSGGFSSAGLGKVEAQARIARPTSAIGCIRASALTRLCACLAVERLGAASGRHKACSLARSAPAWRARAFELRQPLGPLPLERVIAAGIERHLAALQVQDVVDDIVEQVALVADDQHRRPVGLAGNSPATASPRGRDGSTARRAAAGPARRRARRRARPASASRRRSCRAAAAAPPRRSRGRRGCARRGPARHGRRSRSAARGSRRGGDGRRVVSASWSSAARSVSAASTVSNGVAGAGRRLLRDIADARRRAASRRCPRPASSSPATTCIRVDLPAPLRPISPTRLPGGSAAVAPSRIVRPPRRTVMALMDSMRGALQGAAHAVRSAFRCAPSALGVSAGLTGVCLRGPAPAPACIGGAGRLGGGIGVGPAGGAACPRSRPAGGGGGVPCRPGRKRGRRREWWRKRLRGSSSGTPDMKPGTRNRPPAPPSTPLRTLLNCPVVAAKASARSGPVQAGESAGAS